MQCPSDRSDLDEHTATNALGFTTNWYSCSTCGGIWSDNVNVNFLDEHPAYKRRTPTSYRMTVLLCPICKFELEAAHGDNMPPGVSVWRCKNGHGYFFPESELAKFKEAQRAKLSYYKLWQIPLSSPGNILLSGFSLLILSAGILLTFREVQRQQMTETFASTIVASQNAVFIPQTGEVVFSLLSRTPEDLYLEIPGLSLSEKLTSAGNNTYWTSIKLPQGQHTYRYAFTQGAKRFISDTYTVTLNEETAPDSR